MNDQQNDLAWFGEKSELLQPKDRFRRGHDHNGGYRDLNGKWRLNIKTGSFIWVLAPVAAGTALEELRKARTKRRLSTHLVVVPKLFTPLWLKQLHKVCNLILFIPPYFPFWNKNMYEPLCLGFCFPFLKYRPWQIKRAPKLLKLGRNMHKLCKEDRMDPGNLLRKLLCFTQRLPTLRRDQLWSLLFFGRKDSVSNKKRGIHHDRDRFAKRSKQVLLNLRKGAEAVSKFLNATYWDWLDGSALLYWRWPSEFQKKARDGFEPCFLHDPPKSRSRQSHFPADDVDKVWNKLRKFLVRN